MICEIQFIQLNTIYNGINIKSNPIKLNPLWLQCRHRYITEDIQTRKINGKEIQKLELLYIRDNVFV